MLEVYEPVKHLKLFVKIVSDFTIFTKSFITDIWKGLNTLLYATMKDFILIQDTYTPLTLMTTSYQELF